MKSKTPTKTLDYQTAPTRVTAFFPLVLIAAGWMLYAAGLIRAEHLDVSRWGPDPDIGGSFQIDQLRSQRFLPFIAVAVFCDLAGLLVLVSGSIRPRGKWLVTLLWIGGLGSIGFHAICLLSTFIFL